MDTTRCVHACLGFGFRIQAPGFDRVWFPCLNLALVIECAAAPQTLRPVRPKPRIPEPSKPPSEAAKFDIELHPPIWSQLRVQRVVLCVVRSGVRLKGLWVQGLGGFVFWF
jgi:hypothetical protein